jgi:hypothetical protein
MDALMRRLGPCHAAPIGRTPGAAAAVILPPVTPEDIKACRCSPP